jgi:hypothetical protein
MKRLVDYDPFTGVTTYTETEGDETRIGYEFDDVTPVLDMNKTLQNDEQYTRDGIKDGWWHYAQIPASLILKWRIEEGIDIFSKNDTKKVFAKLNDPQYRYLKTTMKVHR